MRLRSLTALVFAGATLVAAEAAVAETVYVIAGGYVSCRTSWNVPTDAPLFQAALPKLHPEAYVALCYRSDSTILSYVSDLGEAPVDGNVDGFVEAVRTRMHAAEPGSKLVILGHSYGGWAVLQVAERLVHEFDVAYVATIDPVSTVACPPNLFAHSIQGSATMPYADCTRSPPDLVDGFATIRDAGVTWVQFYQDRYAYLRSTPIDEATTNIYLAYPNLSNFWAWQAHALMDGDARVWEVLVHDIPLATQSVTN